MRIFINALKKKEKKKQQNKKHNIVINVGSIVIADSVTIFIGPGSFSNPFGVCIFGTNTYTRSKEMKPLKMAREHWIMAITKEMRKIERTPVCK